MELNLIATGIELLGASVAKLTVDNTIVDIENDAQRSFGMTINEPQFQNIEKTKEIFSQMTIDFDIIINQSDNDNCNIHFTITGAFLSKGKISEEDFKQLVAINGASALIGIARGKIESLSSSIFNNGKIVIPFVNVMKKMAQRILKYVLLKSFLIMELRNILQQICLTRQLPSQCFKNYTFIAGL